MTIAHVQDAAIGSAGSATSQQSLAFGANPTVGNYLAAWAWGWSTSGINGATACAFTDTAGGNTWVVPTNAFQQQHQDLWCCVAYAKVANTGASFKVTATPGPGTITGSVMCCAAEFSGVAASSPLDGAAGAGATGTGVTVAPGNLALTSGSLVVYVGTDDNTTFTGSTPSGFTRVGFQNNGSTFQAGEGGYAINPASPSNPSRTITSAKWAAAQFALLAVASAQDTPELYGRPCGLRGMWQQAQLLSQ